MNDKDLNDKSILIVGGTGYIGSSLLNSLKDRCKHVTTWGSEVDLLDQDVWRKQLKSTDLIYYLAAQTSSKYANENPLSDSKINLFPIITLIDICTRDNLRPEIIFAGTVTEVGLTTTIDPVDENTIDKPITIYDLHKLAAEKYLYYYANILGGAAGVLRLANVYGPSSSESKASDRGIVSYFVKNALQKLPITLYGDGKLVRDYVFIDDVIQAFILAGTYVSKLNGESYIISTGKGHTMLDIAQIINHEIANSCAFKTEIKFTPMPKEISPIEFRNFIGNSAKFSKITSWMSKINLADGIAKTVEFYKGRK